LRGRTMFDVLGECRWPTRKRHGLLRDSSQPGVGAKVAPNGVGLRPPLEQAVPGGVFAKAGEDPQENRIQHRRGYAAEQRIDRCSEAAAVLRQSLVDAVINFVVCLGFPTRRAPANSRAAYS